MDISVTVKFWVLPLLRIAVPIFFMITGLFYDRIYDAEKAGKQIKKIAIFALVANLLHVAWEISKLLLNGDSITIYFKEVIKPTSLIELFCFNQPVWRTSIWYINALLYVLILVYILQKRNKQNVKKLYPLIPFLLIGNFVLGTYAPVLFGESVSLFYSRNFLLCGLPYFLIGNYLSNHIFRIKNKLLFLLISTFYFVTLLEQKLLFHFDLLFHCDLFIGTTLLAVTIFLLFMQNENWFNNKICVTLAGYGKNYSFIIYIVHSIIIEMFSKVISMCGSYTELLENIFRWCGPIVVLICSTFVAAVWVMINKNIKQLRTSKNSI